MNRTESGRSGTNRSSDGGLIRPHSRNGLMSRLAACVLLGLVTACGAAPVARPAAQQSPIVTAGLQSASPRPGPTVVVSASPQVLPTPSPSPPVVPSPLGHLPVVASTLGGHLAISCTGTIGDKDPVAIAFLHGQTFQVLRDYADPAHPRSVCTFGLNVFPMEILDPHHVVVQAA